MSPSKLGVFANLALVASAVLIPSTITAEGLGDNNALETLVINPFKRSVALECPGCASATLEGASLKWTEGTGNAFLLDFEVGPNEDTLDLAGNKLYPPTFGKHTQRIYVTQATPNSNDGLRLAVTGYSLHFSSAETVSEAGTELLPVEFQILSIESLRVVLPVLTINLLKDTEGHLMIASFQTQQATQASSATQEKECREWPLLCKWKGIVADRLETLKSIGKPGCHKRPHHGLGRPQHDALGHDTSGSHDHHNPMTEETTQGKPPHRFRPGRPQHHPHHMDHTGHHRHHHIQTFFRHAFFTVLVPILIGIFAATLTYLVGVTIGYIIAIIIGIVVANVRGESYQRVALEDDVEEAGYSDEKEVVVELPAYDELPVYVQPAEKESVEESN